MRCAVSDKLNLPGHAVARIGSARRGWCSWTAAVFGGQRRATPWSPGPRKHIEGRITGSRLATTTKSWSSPWPHASALRAVTPHHGHRRRSGRAHHNLQLPRLSTAQVCSRQGGFYGWLPQERAGLPASWWRAASLLTSARPPRRSSLRSVSRNRISTMRAVGGGCRVFGEGTGRFGVSFACSPPPSTAGYFSPRRWAFPVTRPMRADQLGSGTFSSY